MQTYKYHFPANGDYTEDLYDLPRYLGEDLRSGPDCLMAYCMFPTESQILDYVDLDSDGTKLTGINLHTYTQLWEGSEEDLRICVQENLNTITEGRIQLSGPVEVLEREGTVPKTLYHITDVNKLDSILDNGLTPTQGKNSYKSYEDYVYLCEEKDIAPWLAILKDIDTPVIIAIDTKNQSGIESGRVFNDREYIQEEYTEYRTKDVIPQNAISLIDFETMNEHGIRLDKAMCERLAGKILQQFENAKTISDMSEARRGMERAVDLKILNKQIVNDIITNHPEPKETPSKLSSVLLNVLDEGLPWDENDNGRNPNKMESIVETRRKEYSKTMREMPTLELCEMIRAHFESNATMPGEKKMKDTVNEMLDKEPFGMTITMEEKEALADKFAKARIRETPLKPNTMKLKFEQLNTVMEQNNCDHVAEIPGAGNSTIYVNKIDAQLKKSVNGSVLVTGKGSDSMNIIIGELPNSFVKNNPMNIKECRAEVQITDYSNGKLKNVSMKVVVDTDLMSGNILEMNDDMLKEFENTDTIEQ